MTRVHDSRLGTRKNLFVVAQLSWENGSASVRIRNISSVGALLEGAQLPSVNTSVQLSRGACSAAGQLAWVQGGRAGFEALEAIIPDDWLPLHSRVRKSDPPIASTADNRSASVPASHLHRDQIMAENLVRIRTMVEDVRLKLSLEQSLQHGRQIVTTLDDIYRLLTWQVGELQP